MTSEFVPELRQGQDIDLLAFWPEIETIDDILPHVAENKAIKLHNHGRISVLRYMINGPEVFQTRYDIECRGLVFDSRTGRLLSRPLQKCFNAGERVSLEFLPVSDGTRLMEKLDGSMIAALCIDEEIHFHTKGGISRQAEAAGKRAGANVMRLVREALDVEATPIFEWTSPDNRIVIPYERDEMRLIAIRDRKTGKYLFDLAEDLCKAHGVGQPSTLAMVHDTQDLLRAVAEMQGREDIEGGVLWLPNGGQVKIKTPSYLKIHKTLTMLSYPRYAFRVALEEMDDDILPMLPERQKDFLLDYTLRFRKRLLEICEETESRCESLATMTRKEAAGLVNTTIESHLRPLFFSRLNGCETMESLRSLLEKNLGSATLVEEANRVWDLPVWNPPSGLFLKD